MSILEKIQPILQCIEEAFGITIDAELDKMVGPGEYAINFNMKYNRGGLTIERPVPKTVNVKYPNEFNAEMFELAKVLVTLAYHKQLRRKGLEWDKLLQLFGCY